jgi:hypothetical protein
MQNVGWRTQKDHLEYVDVDVRTILKWVVMNGVDWTIWLRIWTVGRLL